MSFTRFVAFVVSALAFSAYAAPGSAGENWRIVQSTGAVKAGGSGFMAVAVTSNQVLPADSWVETAASGRAVLMRGAESIAVGPNSRVQLPEKEVDGNTQVLQTLGTALYQIGKQQKPHFQVDTPYLAAVVKGTTFTVFVEEKTASVEVMEGLVEVATPDRADVEYVRPGFTGTVSRDQHGSVVVAPSDHSAAPQPDKPIEKTLKGKSASLDSPQRVVIAAPIGEVNLDVKAVSGGLALGSVEPAVIGGTATGVVREAGEGKATGVVAGVGGAVTGVVATAVDVVSADPVGGGTPASPVAVDAGPVSATIDAGDASGGLGVGVGVDLGGGNGTGGGNGVGVDVAVGTGNGGAGLALGVGHGSGGGLGIGLGGGNTGGNGNGGGK